MCIRDSDSDVPVLEPVLSYQVLLPEGADVHAALGKLHRLEAVSYTHLATEKKRLLFTTLCYKRLFAMAAGTLCSGYLSLGGKTR